MLAGGGVGLENPVCLAWEKEEIGCGRWGGGGGWTLPEHVKAYELFGHFEKATGLSHIQD